MAISDRVRQLAGELAAGEEPGSVERRLPDTTWKHLMDAGVLRALQPAGWGGVEADLVDFLDGVFEVARAAPSAGWVAGIVGSHSWRLSLFPEPAQQELWGNGPARMVSSSYASTGTIEPVDSGYRVSGRWSFSPGCEHCDAVILDCCAGETESGSSRVPDVGSLMLLRDEYRIEDTWVSSGLRGTGSNDIVVDGVVVPTHRFLSHVRHEYQSGVLAPGQHTNEGYPYRLPWAVLFNLALVAPTLGMAQGFLDTWSEATVKRRSRSGGSAGEEALMQRHLAQAYWTLDAAVTKMRRAAIELTDAAQDGRHVERESRARYRWDINRGCELVGDAISDLYRVSSGKVVFVDHPLHSRYQNIVSALSHVFLSADTTALAYGARQLDATPPEVLL